MPVPTCPQCGKRPFFVNGKPQWDKHECEVEDRFSVWLNKHLEEAVDAFRQSDLFKFELFYIKWRTTHK